MAVGDAVAGDEGHGDDPPVRRSHGRSAARILAAIVMTPASNSSPAM